MVFGTILQEKAREFGSPEYFGLGDLNCWKRVNIANYKVNEDDDDDDEIISVKDNHSSTKDL